MLLWCVGQRSHSRSRAVRTCTQATFCRCFWPSRRPPGRSSWREVLTLMPACRRAPGRSDRSRARLRWTMPFRSRSGATTICGIWCRQILRSIYPNRTNCQLPSCWKKASLGSLHPGMFCETGCPKPLIVRRKLWLESLSPTQEHGATNYFLGSEKLSSSQLCSAVWSGGRQANLQSIP